MAIKSTALQIFRDRIAELNQHTQLIDASLILANKTCINSQQETISNALNCPNHQRLSHPNTNIQRNRIIAFSRSKLNERAIIDIYKFFSEYISRIIADLTRVAPNNILANLNNADERLIRYQQILEIGNYEGILDYMASVVFRSLENKKSTKILVNRLMSNLKINLNESVLNDALLYLEIRHLIIHNNSHPDDNFKKLNTEGKVKYNKNRIKCDYSTTQDAIAAVYRLCIEINNNLKNTGLIK